MKKSLILLAVGAALVGCERRESDVNEPAGASSDASMSEQRQQAVEEQSKAQQEQIEQRAEAQKEQLKAKQEQIEAEAKAQKQQLEAQAKSEQARIEEAAGAAGRQAQTNINQGLDRAPEGSMDQAQAQMTQADRQLSQQVRQSLTSQRESFGQGFNPQNLQVEAHNGTVTLRGNVSSQQQSEAIEASAKAVPGVQKVENELEVKK